MDGAQANRVNRKERWSEWVRENGAKLLLFARQRTRSREDAEDLVQAAIIRLWQSDPTCECPTMGQMVRMIRWGAIDQGRRITRREGREMEYHQSLTINLGEYFDPDFEERERSRMVQEALQGLEADQRDVIVLKIWGGMTAVEIADALSLSANTVASRYRYGINALKKRLGVVLS